MAAPRSIAFCRRILRTLPLFAIYAAVAPLLTSCDRESADGAKQIDGLRADVDESKRRISHLQNSLAAKDAELAVNTQALEAAKAGITDMETALNERNAQLRAAKIELDELKKKDAFAFAEIAATQDQGSAGLAIARYQKFIADHPKSSLVPNANYAIAQLSATTPDAAPKQVAKLDPARKEKDFEKTFNEGYMTLAELAPYLKKKTVAQVLALCGRPNQMFNDGTEIGYADRAINPATGARGMLVVGFEGGTVATLRVEYGGRKFTP